MSIVLLLPAVAAGIQAVSGPVGPQVIVSEERWEGQNRTVTRNIVVADGGTLVIENSTLDLRIEQICSPIRGTLGYCQPEINVREGGQLVVENSTLTSSFERGRESPVIRADGGNMTIRDSNLSRLGAVRAQFDGFLEFRNNHVESMNAAVGVWRGSDGIVADSRFEEDSGGATARDASPEIRNNTFVNISAWSVGIRQSVVGDKAYTTDPLVVDNVFVSPDQGIFTDSGAGVLIAHNKFVDARFHGVNAVVPTMDNEYRMLDQDPPRITANVFVNSGYRAVDLSTKERQTSTLVSRVQITGNVILESQCNHIRTEEAPMAPLEVDARYNWWGTPQGPPQTPMDSPAYCQEPFAGPGSFQVQPWLKERPSNAGPRTS